jgi:glycosyltransferase involved in cell wall biosynthesis
VRRVAYFSPLPPARTGIADYSAQLLPYLAQELELELFVQEPRAVAPSLRDRFPIHSHAAFPALRRQFDLPLYHVGNNARFHREIYTTLLRYPGLVVLHDVVLHPFVAEITLGEGDYAAYAREMAYEGGPEGLAWARAVRRVEAPLPVSRWSLNRRVVDTSLGVVVHSAYAYRKLARACPRARLRHVEHLLPLPVPRDRTAARARLGVPRGDFLLVTCGHIIPEKHLELTLQAFTRFRRHRPETRWLVVGQTLPGYAGWSAALERSDVQDQVLYKGYVAGLDALYEHLAAADVSVNLRYPTAGETSGSVLRAMGMGLPTILSDVGWYAELPAGGCLRIRHDGSEVEQLEAAFEHWYAAGDARRAAGRANREYVARTCDPARMARAYASFMEDILRGERSNVQTLERLEGG